MRDTTSFEARRHQDYASSKSSYARALFDRNLPIEAKVWQEAAARCYAISRYLTLASLPTSEEASPCP